MAAMFASQRYCEIEIKNICKPLGFPPQCCIKGVAYTRYLSERFFGGTAQHAAS